MRSFVHSVAPGFQQTMGTKAPVEDLLMDNIVKLNLAYTEMSSEDIRQVAVSAPSTVVKDICFMCVAMPPSSDQLQDLQHFWQELFQVKWPTLLHFGVEGLYFTPTLYSVYGQEVAYVIALCLVQVHIYLTRI